MPRLALKSKCFRDNSNDNKSRRRSDISLSESEKMKARGQASLRPRRRRKPARNGISRTTGGVPKFNLGTRGDSSVTRGTRPLVTAANGFPINPIPFAKRRPYEYDVGMAVHKKPSAKRRASAISIPPEELLRELPGAKLVAYDPGALIIREGTKATNCYVITEGKARILKRTSQGENIPLGLVKRGEFLGEMAMLSGERRSASAIAFTHVKAIVIEHDDFIDLLKDRHPFASRLSLQISCLLATRCHRLLRLIAHRPEVVPLAMKKAPPIDVRDVLNRIYTLWAV